MKHVELKREDFSALMGVMAELHEWELAHMPMMRTVTGRNLYYRVIQSLSELDPAGEKALKEVFSSNHFTARAMRTRMQAMCDAGWLELQAGQTDARMKHLTPTASFHEITGEHAQQLFKLLNRFFLIIHK